ncbi:MAG: CDGSH iron-sulfur domain-containing protein [Chloroflexota bacterium]
MADVDVTIRTNGPYLISGPISLQDADGNVIDITGRERVALCRCGSSAKKPFCDGGHNRVGFDGTLAKPE